MARMLHFPPVPQTRQENQILVGAIYSNKPCGRICKQVAVFREDNNNNNKFITTSIIIIILKFGRLRLIWVIHFPE
jgi:hypothetical protein